MRLGNARVSRGGDGVFAIADFLCNSSFRAADASYEKLVSARRRNQHARRVRYPEVQRERVFNKDTAFVI